MKIISYNINGIRAAIRKGFVEWLKEASPDVICLQEIKANVDQFNVNEFEKSSAESLLTPFASPLSVIVTLIWAALWIWLPPEIIEAE